MNFLTRELLRHQQLYYVQARPEIRDEEYDRLLDELLRLEQRFPQYASPNSPSRRVGSDLDNAFPEREHALPVLSLDKAYTVEEAVALLKKAAYAKFDESVDLSLRLGVNPKYSDQMVRGTLVLPHGTGRTKKICVIAAGEKIKEAEQAGADFAGGDEIIEKIAGGWIDFDIVIATPDVMRGVGKLGRILGTKGLMPNPKAGTVTFDIRKAVEETKAGKVEFRVDKTSIVHSTVGKVSFEEAKLVDNMRTFIQAILHAKPPAAKGKYVRSLFVSSTMGPSFRISEDILES